VSKVKSEIDIVSFLDDDIILERNYFEEILNTFSSFSCAVGVGGIDLKENSYFKKVNNVNYSKFRYYELDDWVIKESSRNLARKLFGLMPSIQPDIVPNYSHGRSGFPPNGKTYKVEHFMGGIAAYRKDLFHSISFSSYFEGYGLYEDFDFCVRTLKYGDLYVNTNAQVWHYHESSGRPNTYKYGKMVIRNGWYVWKQRFPRNSKSAVLKWHATAFLLSSIRFFNFITGPKRVDALKEFFGRTVGWFSLWFDPPKLR
jgi:GT2 family glycosyltransferase